jgi:AraC-like DNA-binding protein
MNLIDEIFETLKLQGLLYFRTDFTGPWGVTVPELGAAARFHFVLSGRCFVRVNEQLLELSAGDLILIPAGKTHSLSHSEKSSCPQLEKVLEQAGYQDQGVLRLGVPDESAATKMLCGHVSFRPGASHPLLDALPAYLHITSQQRAENPILDDVLRLLARCLTNPKQSSDAALTRLAEIIFLEAVKTGAESSRPLENILLAFADDKVSSALKLMHSYPEESWTVERLASQVAMSRSRFADRFSVLMGTGPMSYLAEWRLQRAMQQLSGSRLSVQQIAITTGYKSPSAFTRAFTDRYGVSPSQYRMQNRSLPNVS